MTDYRCKYHLMPPDGWLNDPNGLCQYQGTYHVFFQYAKGQPEGGLISWGHYTSKDLIHWEFLGTPIEPENDFEKSGVYSGCAYVDEAGINLYYTGNVKHPGDYDYTTAGRDANQVYAICRDGIHVEEKQVVLANADYPEKYSCHVRDPKVWKEGETYYMVLGGRTREDHGEILVYSSSDKVNWKWEQEITSPDFGYMWECPDLFSIEGQQILSYCPQGLAKEEYRYQNAHQAGYCLFDGKPEGSYTLGGFREWDMGFDFYAPQTFEDEKGRRILIGWIGLPDKPYENANIKKGWQNMLTMPRELTLKEDRVLQYPVEEMKNLRRESSYEKVSLDRENQCYKKEARAIEIHLDNQAEQSFVLNLEDEIYLIYDQKSKCLKLKFQDASKAGGGRTERNVQLSSCRELQVFVDTSVLEIYVNQGEVVLTTQYFLEKENREIQICAKQIQIETWEMDGCTGNY